MNEALLNAMNTAISNLDTLSDAELQAKFEAHKNGPVGRAIFEGKTFAERQTADASMTGVTYTASRITQESTSDAHFKDIGVMAELLLPMSNDKRYLMAV